MEHQFVELREICLLFCSEREIPCSPPISQLAKAEGDNVSLSSYLPMMPASLREKALSPRRLFIPTGAKKSMNLCSQLLPTNLFT